jgi:hypothetical protein
MQELEKAKRWFLEFMAAVHPDVDVNALYFTLGAPEPDVALLKEYARYFVMSRVGQSDMEMSVGTVQHYMRLTIAVSQRVCNHPKTLISATQIELNKFVAGTLVQQENVIATMPTKRRAHLTEVTAILVSYCGPGI